MSYTAVLCALNAKYIHSSLAPWCLAAGVQAYAKQDVRAVVAEGTINEPQENVLARLLALQPRAITFSCYLWNITQTLCLARALKQALPEIVVICGGPEVSYNACDVLRNHPQIDYILAGEGETSVPALLDALAQGQSPLQAHVPIPGLCARSTAIQNGHPRIVAAPPCVLEGDVPSPYTAEYLANLRGRIAYLETSRGCPYACAFCLSGRCGKPRFFDLEAVKQNLLLLANSGARTVKLIDRTFNANPAHANEILRFILTHYGRGIPAGVCFHFEIAGDILREETFALLAQAPAGAFQLEIGMQSFHEKTLAAVRRQTDTRVLRANISRLVAMGNMHIHIDLIAGLPYEDLNVFGKSFDMAYALGANMLQLGFLKLLHGAAMREEPHIFPCVFSSQPPYEVCSTPWLTPGDIAVLHAAEDALERMYNTGRFRGTAAYVLAATGQTPFSFYCALGAAALQSGVEGISLDNYTAFLYDYCAVLPGIDTALLRDAMVCDRLATNATGRLPACLHIRDDKLTQAVKALAAHPATAPLPQVKRGVALLYGAQQIVFVDYTCKHPVTGRYALRKTCGFVNDVSQIRESE